MHLLIKSVFLVLPHFFWGAEIALVTIAAGKEYNQIVQPGILNKSAYCAEHGYDFICHEETLDPERPIPWSKIVAILRAMEDPGRKWIFWTDADALIMNHSVALEDLIDENYDFLISKDPNAINSGHFLIRNCLWSRRFLENVYSHTECIHDCWWENRAIIFELDQHPELLERTKFIPQRMFNSYPEELGLRQLTTLYQPGDFILHYPSGRARLASFFSKYVPLVINHQNHCNLQHYLSMYGYHLNDPNSIMNRYIDGVQKSQIYSGLASCAKISHAAQLGLKDGQCAEIFLKACPYLKRLICFDRLSDPCSEIAEQYLRKRFKGVFDCVNPDVLSQMVENRYTPFEFVYFDGERSYQECLQRIMEFQGYSEEGAMVWVNAYEDPEVRAAVDQSAALGILEITQIHHTHSRARTGGMWVEAKYLKKL